MFRFENDMRKYGEYFNWRKLSDHQKMSLDFVRENADRVHWDRITQRIKMTDDFIEEFKDKVTWDYVWSYQYVTEKFIENHMDKADWDRIARYQRYSMDFAIKHQDKIELDTAFAYCKKKISEKWIEEHLDLINGKYHDKYKCNNYKAWGSILQRNKFDEEFHNKYMKYYDDYAWRILSQYQKVSLDFIEKHAKKISWFWLWHNNNVAVNKDFIKKIKAKGIDVGPYYKNY